MYKICIYMYTFLWSLHSGGGEGGQGRGRWKKKSADVGEGEGTPYTATRTKAAKYVNADTALTYQPHSHHYIHILTYMNSTGKLHTEKRVKKS
jgi:hypothetical protein